MNAVRFTAIEGIVVYSGALLARYAPALFLVIIYSVFGLFLLDFNSQQEQDWKHFAKLSCLLPLGLGSLMMFRVFLAKYVRFLPAFSHYVNFAVVGNIAMMLFIPNDSPSTYRAYWGRIICAGLAIWLCLEIKRTGSAQTCAFSKSGMFIFKAAPLRWIITHALYRFILITLPCFLTPRYLFVEAFSLSTMMFLYWLDGKQHPIENYFGYADSITAACVGITSAFSPANIEDSTLEEWVSHETLDRVFVPVQVFLLCEVASVLWRFARSVESGRETGTS